MSGDHAVAGHYAHGTLLAAITAGLAALGKTPATVSVEDLAPVDEFHIGGREASEAFLGQLPLDAGTHALDVGCGLGGASRFAASRFGSRVTGIDLTPEYVETGRTLCAWVGLDDRVALHQGSALELPFDDAGFDAAYMMHVGMNIPDKDRLFAEVFRVLRPGAAFGVYDIMRLGAGELSFPLPWATTAETSAVAAPETYRRALQTAGFEVAAERNRRDFALDFFAATRARIAADGGPPPLGLHVLMGASGAEKIGNLVEDLAAGRIAPVEMIAHK